MRLPVYVDYNATTPVDPRVVDAMLPYLGERFGNPSSRMHRYGREAAEAVERAREQLAGLIGVYPDEVLFTGGATESDNLALKGVFEHAGRAGHLVTSAVEHPAVLEAARWIERHGGQVTRVPVSADGIVDPQAVADAITPETLLVSVMLANNETGAVNPLEAIGELCRERGVLLHSDVVQAMGKIPFAACHVDLASLTAHKMYGPKGTGALYVSARVRARVAPQLEGGGQERGLRGGTLNTAGIVGFGAAAAIAERELEGEGAAMQALRQRLLDHLRRELSDVCVNGALPSCLPNTLNASFGGVESEALLMALPDVALSSGSACASGHGAVSHVLKAMGLPEERIHGAIRFSLGRFSDEEQVDYVADRLATEVRRLRDASPVWAVRRS